MAGYIGINGTAKKVKNIYLGIGNLAKKVSKAYIGVGGVAKLWYTSGSSISYLRNLNYRTYSNRDATTSALVGDYFIHNETPYLETGNSEKGVISSTLTLSSRKNYSSGSYLNGGQAASLPSYAVFITPNGTIREGDYYTSTLTVASLDSKIPVKQEMNTFFGNGNYILGISSDGYLLYYNNSLTTTTTSTKFGASTTYASSYYPYCKGFKEGWIVWGGRSDTTKSYKTICYYNSSFTKSNMTAIPSSFPLFTYIHVGTNDNYCLLVGYCNQDYVYYNTSLTQGTITPSLKFSYNSYQTGCTGYKDLFLVYGGQSSSKNVSGLNTCYVYDSALTSYVGDSLNDYWGGVKYTGPDVNGEGCRRGFKNYIMILGGSEYNDNDEVWNNRQQASIYQIS